MGAQTSYSFAAPVGVAGGLYDLNVNGIDSRANESEDGALLYGAAAMTGTTGGRTVKAAASGDTLNKFEGIVVNTRSFEQTQDGQCMIAKNQAVSVLRYGRCWVRIPDEEQPAYGEQAYVSLEEGKEGLITKSEGSGNLKIKARFIGGKGAGNVAPVELYHQMQE